ncbi:hypothetical protein I553_6236 [Mycobacterium xenopi 4042]|uniref:Uncharacterized protein n=1 Tax=Mycobacterium xenopi 4042 TaxID=1299334 RepID=X8BFZ3_MYCXE|nr:hypothetical protein I553_6236 [Mycobacterium xenopi 4042]
MFGDFNNVVISSTDMSSVTCAIHGRPCAAGFFAMAARSARSAK